MAEAEAATGVEELAGGIGEPIGNVTTGEVAMFTMDKTEDTLVGGGAVIVGEYCGYIPVPLEVAMGAPLKAPVFLKAPLETTPVPARAGPSDQSGAVLWLLAP